MRTNKVAKRDICDNKYLFIIRKCGLILYIETMTVVTKDRVIVTTTVITNKYLLETSTSCN